MPTIKDVAERAGVSVATVSRIMNNRGPIGEKTRKKVHKAMKELNYQPNEMARALQKSKSHILGLIVPSISYAFFSKLADAIEEACHEQGYKLMLCKSGNEHERELEMVSLLYANKVDGILICSRVGDASIYTNYNLPIVSIDRDIDLLPSVTSDNYNGGVLAAQALLRAGCKTPLIFGGAVPEYMAMDLRYKGFREECFKRGVVFEEHFVGESDLRHERLQEEFISFVTKRPQIDGVFITGDMIAAKLLCSERITSLLNSIPMIGYDGLEISNLLGITTVEQPISEMGEYAVNLLIRKVEAKAVPERSILPVRLIERKSTLRFMQE